MYMKYSAIFAKTTKQTPKDEVSVNAKFLLQGGYIDKLMAGSYTLLPLGRRVERKIEQIIRTEMDKTGAQEVLMPLIHPKEIWNETGRWETAREVMYQFEKNDKSYALSFTHEEIVMDLIRKHVSSYKDLPVKLYHFSTKFRNELRAKSGILRGREFLMKDLYSAHASKEDMTHYYWQVADAYTRAFEKIGLKTIIAEAAGGVFTSEHTHEFQVEAESGEDTIYLAPGWKYAKNKEIMTDEDMARSDVKAITSIEVGNIFPLGLMYSEKMEVMFTDKDGRRKPIWLASYGIGPTRVLGTIVEVSHDGRGIIWPVSVAPYVVHIVSINQDAGALHDKLSSKGVDVLYDDRDAGAGEKLSDADLLGMPVRLVVSAKNAGKIEWKERQTADTELLTEDEVVKRLQELQRSTVTL